MVSASLQHRGRRGVPYRHRKAQRPLSEPSGFAREPEARGGEEGVRRGEGGGKGRNDKTNMRSNACVLLAACGFPNRCRCPSVNSLTREKPYHTPQQGGENERAWQVLCRKRHTTAPRTAVACRITGSYVGRARRGHYCLQCLVVESRPGQQKAAQSSKQQQLPNIRFPAAKACVVGVQGPRALQMGGGGGGEGAESDYTHDIFNVTAVQVTAPKDAMRSPCLATSPPSSLPRNSFPGVIDCRLDKAMCHLAAMVGKLRQCLSIPVGSLLPTALGGG